MWPFRAEPKDTRSGRIVFLIECLLNQNARDSGAAESPATTRAVIDLLADKQDVLAVLGGNECSPGCVSVFEQFQPLRRAKARDRHDLQQVDRTHPVPLGQIPDIVLRSCEDTGLAKHALRRSSVQTDLDHPSDISALKNKYIICDLCIKIQKLSCFWRYR